MNTQPSCRDRWTPSPHESWTEANSRSSHQQRPINLHCTGAALPQGADRPTPCRALMVAYPACSPGQLQFQPHATTQQLMANGSVNNSLRRHQALPPGRRDDVSRIGQARSTMLPAPHPLPSHQCCQIRATQKTQQEQHNSRQSTAQQGRQPTRPRYMFTAHTMFLTTWSSALCEPPQQRASAWLLMPQNAYSPITCNV